MSDPAPSAGGLSLPEMDVGGRLDRLRPSLVESGLGGLLVTNVTNVTNQILCMYMKMGSGGENTRIYG